MSTATIEQPPELNTLETAATAAADILRLRVRDTCSEQRKFFLQPILDHLVQGRGPASSKHANHGASHGGLLLHTLDVLDIASLSKASLQTKLDMDTQESTRAGVLQESMPGEYFEARRLAWNEVTPESITTVAIIHDLNKVADFSGNVKYIQNVLKSGKVSDATPYKANENFAEWESVASYLSTNSSLGWMRVLLRLDLPGEVQVPSGLVSLAHAERLSSGIIDQLTAAEKQAIIFHGGLYEKGDKTGFMNFEHPLTILIHFADMLASRVGF